MPFFLVIAMYLSAVGIIALPAEAAHGAQATVAGEADREAQKAGTSDHKEAVTHERDMVREIAKQAYEQPLHFLMSAGPIWVSRYLTAVPWYGWSVIPALVYREWRQWPSDRWWDPLLDATFLILGVIGATWRRSALRAPMIPRRMRPHARGQATPIPDSPRQM